MPFLNHWWLIGLLVIVLIVFGPGKLPQIGGAVGQAMREFRKATSELKDEVAKATTHEAEPPAVPTASIPPVIPPVPTTISAPDPAAAGEHPPVGGHSPAGDHRPESTKV